MDRTALLVADVMTIDPIVLSVGTSLEVADALLRASFVTGLPVVDGDGILVGVITQTDLVAYRFARPTLQPTPPEWSADLVAGE